MRWHLLWLVLVVLVPVLVVQLIYYINSYYKALEDETVHNAEVAHGLSLAFNGYVRDIVREEAALGEALTKLKLTDPQEAREFLGNAVKEYSGVRSFHWTDAQGRIIASSDPRALGLSIADRPYFLKLQAGARSSVSDLVTGRASGEPTFLVARASRNQAGALEGVAFASIQPDKLGLVTLAWDRPALGRIAIYDSQGTLIYRRPETPLTASDRERGRDERLLREALNGQPGHGQAVSPFDGVELTSAFVPLPEIGWVVSASRPVDQVRAPILRRMALAVGVMMLIAAGSLLVALSLSHKILAAVGSLQAQAAAIARGDLEPQPEAGGTRELQHLSQAFNRAAGSLLTAREEREQRAQRLGILLRASTDVLKAHALPELLDSLALAARDLTDAHLAICGHGYLNGQFRVGASSRTAGHDVCPSGQEFRVDRGGLYLDLITKRESLRLSTEEVERHPSWQGLPPGHAPLRGLLGVRLVGLDGQANGVIMATNKEQGEFTAEDEALLKQLAAIASLALQHIEARTAAEEGQQRLRMHIENSPLAVVEWDAGFHIARWTGAAERIFGWTADEMLGKHISEVKWIHEDDIPKVQALMAAMLAGTRPSNVNPNRNYRKDGQIIYCEWYNSALMSPEGQMLSVLSLTLDVTDRMTAEADLRRLADDLARSNQDLTQFAYVASHDLQEPLRMVTGYLQLIERRYRNKLDQDADEFIDYAVDGVTRMQALINDLLSYSRVGTQARDARPTNMEEVWQRVIRDLQPAIAQSGAVVTSGPLPTIKADSTQMAQLLQNLVSNAIKFKAPERRPEIRVEAVQQDDGRWRFSVQDNGIGLEPQYNDRIFVIFQRLHARDKYPGTGIGLAICKRIVERHGGRIWVESRAGQGAVFCFTI